MPGVWEIANAAANLRNEKRTYSYKIVGRHERSGTVAQAGANILAGNVDIKVDGDLRNKGGVIAADEDATLIAGGNISNEAVKERDASSSTTKKTQLSVFYIIPP